MTPSLLQFNFHNIAGVQVEAEESGDAAFFAAEYRYHQVEQIPQGLPMIVLRFKPWNGFSQLPDGYTSHAHKFVARWGYVIAMAEDQIEIDVMGNASATPMVHHMLLHPCLRYLAAQRGVLMLHAGAVSWRGRSLIFTGHGGAGKTTTTSLLLALGGEAWSPHADDYVFIAPGPESLAYMTRSHLYLDLLRWVPDLASRLTPNERLRLEIHGRLRAWSRENIKMPVRLSMERLWPGRTLEERADPAAFVILKRANVHAPTLHRLSPEEAPLDDLIRMNFSEARHFLTLLEKSRAIPDLSGWLANWQQRERELLHMRFQEMPLTLLELPRQASSAEMQVALVEKLAGLVEARPHAVAGT